MYLLSVHHITMRLIELLRKFLCIADLAITVLAEAILLVSSKKWDLTHVPHCTMYISGNIWTLYTI